MSQISSLSFTILNIPDQILNINKYVGVKYQIRSCHLNVCRIKYMPHRGSSQISDAASQIYASSQSFSNIRCCESNICLIKVVLKYQILRVKCVSNSVLVIRIIFCCADSPHHLDPCQHPAHITSCTSDLTKFQRYAKCHFLLLAKAPFFGGIS